MVTVLYGEQLSEIILNLISGLGDGILRKGLWMANAGCKTTADYKSSPFSTSCSGELKRTCNI